MGMITLARWLGPWADSQKSPDVHVVSDEIAGVQVNVYARDERQHGKPFLIAPGLHYAGPADPRMDRFCRVLAAAGHVVVAPFIRDYLALTPNVHAITDFRKVFDRATWREKPTVFSISFGSQLALALAAERGDEIERLVLFGPYSDFHETMRFCLTGEVASGRKAVRDPLNQPVVLMNLLDLIEHDREHAATLAHWWREYVQLTWGRPEMKERERFVAVAEQLAPQVPESVRELFLIGIGARPGAWDLALPALAKFDSSALDPAPYLSRVRVPVDLVHGTADDVIPFEQSHALARGLTNTRVNVHITGLYGHTGAQRPALSALAQELLTMARVLRVLAG